MRRCRYWYRHSCRSELIFVGLVIGSLAAMTGQLGALAEGVTRGLVAGTHPDPKPPTTPTPGAK